MDHEEIVRYRSTLKAFAHLLEGLNLTAQAMSVHTPSQYCVYTFVWAYGVVLTELSYMIDNIEGKYPLEVFYAELDSIREVVNDAQYALSPLAEK